MTDPSRFDTPRTLYVSLYLGWGVLPLILAAKMARSPRDFGLWGVVIGLYAAAWWACGLAMTAGARWSWRPTVGLVFIAWAMASAQAMRMLRLLLGDAGGELPEAARRMALASLSHWGVLYLLPLSVLLVLGWRLRPQRRGWGHGQGPDIAGFS